mgnify:CR=1 FL=1
MDKFFRVEIFKVQKESNSNVIHLERRKDEYIDLSKPEDNVKYNIITTLFKTAKEGFYYSRKDGYTFGFITITEEEYKTAQKNEIERKN